MPAYFSLGIPPAAHNHKTMIMTVFAVLLRRKEPITIVNGIGYRIQLYNGSEKRAKTIRAKFRIEFPSIETYLKYNAPEWKIQVGSLQNNFGGR